MTAKLKPCPHCGGAAEFENTSENDNFRVVCDKCDGVYWATKSEAIAAWNQRHFAEQQAWEAGRDAGAKIVDDNTILHRGSVDEPVLTPRRAGHLDGLAYAAAIRALQYPQAADMLEATARPAADVAWRGMVAKHIDDWHEDFGDVLWFKFPIDEAPYCGSPLSDEWPGYHTHWIALPDCNLIVPAPHPAKMEEGR
jgi:Lar family restriction alleviation protein